MEDKAKAKAQAKRLVAEKARKARGKVVEEKPLEADKGLEKAQVLVKVQAKARVLVLEKEVKVNLADRAKALEAVKVQAKALEKVVVRVKAKAKVQAKAENLERVVTRPQVPTKNLEAEVQVHHPAKANSVENVMEVEMIVPILPKIANLVMAQDNSLKIILLTLCKISQVIYLKHPNKRNKNRLVRLLVNKPKKILINNLNPALKNVMICLI